MKHSAKLIPAGYKNPPSVKIRLGKDAHTKGAFNLFVDLENFRFAPEEVNKTSRNQRGPRASVPEREEGDEAVWDPISWINCLKGISRSGSR